MWLAALAAAFFGSACAGTRLAAPAPSLTREDLAPAPSEAVLVGGASLPVAAEVIWVKECPRQRAVFELTVPIWVPNVSGTFGSGDTTVSGGDGGILPPALEERLPDIVGDLEFAFLGRVRAEWGRWSVTAEGFGVRFGTATEFRGESGEEGDSSATIVRADVGYRLCGKGADPCLSCECRGITLDAIVGARWFDVDVEISTANPQVPDVDASKSWIDPLVGFRGRWGFSPRWCLLAEADVGGFGVGADLTWWASASVRYRISHRVSVEAGWTLLDTDFETGSFQWDVRLTGPRLGITFHL